MSVLINKCGNKAFISFAGLRGGSPVFEFKKFFSNQNVSTVFVKDDQLSWYHAGVPGVGSCIDNMVVGLKKIIKDLGASDVTTVGCSMGGYAALLFGNLLGVKSIAFAPQTFIDEENRAKFGDCRWKQAIERIQNTYEDKYFDILPYVDSNSQLYYGEGCEIDKEHCRRTSGVLHEKPGAHGFVKGLRDSGELREILNDS